MKEKLIFQEKNLKLFNCRRTTLQFRFNNYVSVCILLKKPYISGYSDNPADGHRPTLRSCLCVSDILRDGPNSTRLSQWLHRHFHDSISVDDFVQFVRNLRFDQKKEQVCNRILSHHAHLLYCFHCPGSLPHQVPSHLEGRLFS